MNTIGKTQSNSLCWICSRTRTGGGCEWFEKRIPVKGWLAEKSESAEGTYNVVMCPKVANQYEPIDTKAVPDEPWIDFAHAIVNSAVDDYEKELAKRIVLLRDRDIARFKGKPKEVEAISNRLQHNEYKLQEIRLWLSDEYAKTLGVNNARQIVQMSESRFYSKRVVKLLLRVMRRTYQDTAIRTAIRANELDDEMLEEVRKIDAKSKLSPELKANVVEVTRFLSKLKESERYEVIDEVREIQTRRR